MLPSKPVTSTQQSTNEGATSSKPPLISPFAGKKVNLGTDANDPNRQSDAGGAQGSSRVVQRHFVNSMRGGIIPEKKGGLPKTAHIGVCYNQDVYVFGGVNSKGQCSNHIFCFEKRTLMWREIRGVGVVPRGRTNHAGALIGSKIYIHGGHRQLEIFDDFFAYDIDTGRWEKISCERMQGPGAVFLHSMVYIPPSESLLVLGGIHQREQNIYLGHLFDVRNRVWTGVPPPPSVDAHHLQLVTAAYNASSATVVVLGLMEENVRYEEITPTPYVYLFHPSTFVWKRVTTTTAPASPLPFRMEEMWESLLHFLIPSGGGVFDELLQIWIFPLPLEAKNNTDVEDALIQCIAMPGTEVPPLPLNKYGFLVLDMPSMSWSLVPCNLPRKLVAELNVANRLERDKMERFVTRRNAFLDTAAFSTSSQRINSLSASAHIGDNAVVPPFSSSNIRNPEASRHSLVSQQGLLERSRPVSSNIRSAKTRASVSRGNLPVPFSEAKAAALLSGSRYRRLFSYEDVPEFTRKYIVVIVRNAPTKFGKPRPMQYVLLHGGLTELTDYAMLMFTPALTLMNSGAVASQGGVASMQHRLSLNSRGSSDPRSRQGSLLYQGPDTEDSALDWDFGEDSMMSGGNSSTVYPRQRGLRDAALGTAQAGEEGLARPRTDKNCSDDDDIGEKVHKNAQRKSFLLPTLQMGRTNRNHHSFALQFAPGNSVRRESLLPYANIPVAVLRTPGDVQKWSRNYYADQRRWFAERLKDALSEDRKLRRFRRLNKAREAQMATTSGSRSGPYPANSAAVVDSSDDEQEAAVEKSSFAESFMADVFGRSGVKGTGLLSSDDQLTLDASNAVMSQAEAPKRRLRDFFEEHGLNCFEDDRDLQHQQPQNSLLRVSALDNKDAKQGRQRKDAKPKKKAPFAEGANTKLAKRLNTLPALTSARTPHASMPLMSEVLMTCPVFERLRLKGCHDEGREPMRADFLHSLPIGGFIRGAAEPMLDLRNLPSYALLTWSIAHIRADLDFYETRRRRAQLRWRYLRVLVCTGMAAYLFYLLSQAEVKMNGVAVTGTPGLLLAPDLHLVGPLKSYRLPVKTVPYNVGGSSVPPPPASQSRAAHMTASGMVVYSSLR
ncbi:hypothetical protein JKF63_00136 [Porcisia hertigi]|uniref:Uncharacterized protein n=1 Tax=Porcisia hertigi TaxID=2761500 RepID=A0A836GXR6_9TRYP|nr:hypothetical protein JKF63_00136 [Porcisia hertigi]